MDDKEAKLDQLAWLCLTKPESIKLDDIGLTPEDLVNECQMIDGTPSFVDPEKARARAVGYLQAAVIEPKLQAPAEMFDGLLRCQTASGAGRGDNLPAVALAELHNNGSVDVAQLGIDAFGGGDGHPYRIGRLVADVIPLLDALDIPNVLILVRLLEAKGFLAPAIGNWMKSHPAEIEHVFEGCLAALHLTLVPLLRTSLTVGVQNDKEPWLARVHTLVSAPDPLVALPALEALGFIDWSDIDAAEIDRAVEVIREKLQAGDEAVRNTAARAGLYLVDTAPDRHALIDEIAALEGLDVVQMIGDHLAYGANEPRAQPWYLDKIDLLAAKTGQESGAGHGIDHILAQEYTSGNKSRVLAWVETWARTNAERAPSVPGEFPQLFAQIVSDGEALGALLVAWLIADAIGYQRMARKILDELSLREVRGTAFSVSALDALSAAGLLHLARRTLANVVCDHQRVSLVWSMIRTHDAETRVFTLVFEVMARFIGYDYPVATREHLELLVATGAGDAQTRLAQQILEAMRAYYDPLKGLPVVEELRPSSEQEIRFEKERGRLMNEALEEASKHSFFREVATSIPLKAGRSMFLMRDGEVGETTPMMSASHSVAVPRSEAIDKVGSDMQRRRFILGKLEDDRA
ncbi:MULTISPECIES: hypothetical protein [Xanthomonas]|uniref:hypothetical protein n=1 Tax=Xanthomonas TaxID=338 RepID=UPI0006F327C7|nr:MULTISPECIES: hypothetical protein [Xanthomonas]KQR12858.1 hypothetical protein ASF90_06365 [Xanthomonas sp. Leaf148]